MDVACRLLSSQPSWLSQDRKEGTECVTDTPASNTRPKKKMAYKLATDIGHAIYHLRKCAVGSVIGIIKKTTGFRQISLCGLNQLWTSGAWCAWRSAFGVKRMYVLVIGWAYFYAPILIQ
jgi:hypothetical protein